MVALTDLINVPQFGPLEDLILGILSPLEDAVPGLKVRSWIENDITTPYILVRKEPGSFSSDSFGAGHDGLLIERAVLNVNTFTENPNGDEKGAQLQDIVRRRLITAQQQQIVIPNCGHIAKVQISGPPHRVSDWATSTGVVQYANLPKNMHRYEAVYGLVIRPDLHPTSDLLELFQ